VQKVDTAKVSMSKENTASLTLEDLVHLIDISVASKYGVYLSQLTQVLAEDVCLSHPGSRKQNRSLHTCAQDVQITYTAQQYGQLIQYLIKLQTRIFTK
jgi:hypothetical protein